MPHCAAFGCYFQSKGNTGSDVSLHRFPNDERKRIEWEIACGRKDLPKDPRLCSRHFSLDAFEPFSRVKELIGASSFKRRLKPSAVPTIFSHIKTKSIRTASENRHGKLAVITELMLECKQSGEASGAAVQWPADAHYPTVKDLPLLTSGQSSLTKTTSTETPERIQANPEKDRRCAKTIIDIGSAFALWQKFREENGFRTDTELAFYLLSRTVCRADLSAWRKKRKLADMCSETEECESNSSQPRNGHHCTDEDEDMEVPEICYEVPPSYQTVEPAQTEIKSEDQLRSEDQIKSERQIKLEDQSVALALNNVDIVSESSTSAIKNEIKEEPVETEVQPENRLEVSMDSVTTSDKITPSFVQTVNPVAVKEEQTEEPLVPNKTHFTGLFRTCIQCGEPMQEYTTVSSGSLNQLQWKCSNGHLMCLLPNNNPTQTHTYPS